ncbi:DUF5043 domain-containing protein [Bacteroides sp. 214]|uniref:DUF5043 domain-containing protein n=1 Tax=Bacteroides sp. 214 TaxID=2302935 RepID=UPI0013D07D1A|nr:DUF5043 domain-containing protein [Bacteroides sp. 214]NDW12836.1 DUF5043 domain-containing protein [Bacteroides sp. 214]
MKTIILLISILFCANHTFSQTNYYSTTKTFYESGYTYQCDLNASKQVKLYNKNNTLTYVDQVYKATGKFYTGLGHDPYPLEDDTWTKQRCHSIVNNAFSVVEKQRVKGYLLSIAMYISPDTGRVIEVDFTFISIHPFATIPISVYRNIENEIKQNIWFTPTVEGKKLNYILRSWLQEVE